MKGDTYFFRRIFPILFMFLSSAVFIAIVSAVYVYTRDIVELNETIYAKRALLSAADIRAPEDSEEVEQIYQARIEEVRGPDDRVLYYKVISTDKGETTGYVVVARGPGLWGEIEAAIGFNAELTRLTGIYFVRQNETPGLGGRITEENYMDRFRGKEGPFILAPEGEDDRQDELSAITGASYTSNYVLDLVNTVYGSVRQIVGEVNNVNNAE